MNDCSHDYWIVVAGHGSRDHDGIEEFEEFVASLQTAAGDRRISHGYLEFKKPDIVEAVRSAVHAGARSVVVVPALLTAATHAKNDMPVQLRQLRDEFADVRIDFASAMDIHPLLLQLCRQRIIEAESSAHEVVSRSDSCLVVAGRGSNDPDANADIAKIARLLQEGMGFGASYVSYAGTAAPCVPDGLRLAARLGKKRIVVLPYMLFDGVLVKRILEAADDLSQRHRQVEVLKATHLGATEEVARVFLERAEQGYHGTGHMNCSLCKYRVAIVGYENQLGSPQMTHKPLDERPSPKTPPLPYSPHPIEAESFEIIRSSRDWSSVEESVLPLAQRIVHTAGDLYASDDLFVSPGAVEAGVRALLRCRQIVADVTMVETGLKRALIQDLKIFTWCGVHDPETVLLSQTHGLTRCAAGIRRAWQMFGNDVVIAIGDAPTAVMEVVRLVREQGWRPQLVIGLPVGFVGTIECKQQLKRCLQIPRITNSGTRGGSPWAACVVNALMIESVNVLAATASRSTCPT